MRISTNGNSRSKLVGCLALFLGLCVTSLAIAGYIPGWWFCDLASQFRLVYAVVQLACFVVLLCTRFGIGAAILFAGLIINAIPIITLVPPGACTDQDDRQTVRVLNFNTEFQHNDNFALLEKLIHERDPDIIALVEINRKWIDAIAPTTQRYPDSKVVIVGPGIALFSKFPIERSEVRYFGKSHHPRIIAKIRVGKQLVTILIAHPTTPQSNSGYQERNQELSLIRDEMSLMPQPKVLIGDLNCGPWSPEFSKLQAAGLHDSEQGFGPQPSWPARTGRVIEHVSIPPLIPIDHALVSDDICVVQRVTGPPMQSDHLPVTVRFTLPK